jgi:hypothetical protein
VWRFTLRRKDRIHHLEMLYALIRFRLRGAKISPAPEPFQNSLDVTLPYKIRAVTLREAKFSDFADDLSIASATSTESQLSKKDLIYLKDLFK